MCLKNSGGVWGGCLPIASLVWNYFRAMTEGAFLCKKTFSKILAYCAENKFKIAHPTNRSDQIVGEMILASVSSK